MAPEICPNCNADVPRNAKTCPECGSCESTGWSEEAQVEGLDLPDESFDYEDYVQREFGQKQGLPRGISPIWGVITIVLVLALLGFLTLLFR